MSPLRVSFVADTDSWGGAEVWLVQHLRRAARHGVEPAVVCTDLVANQFRPWVPDDRLSVVPLARHAVRAPATSAALRDQSPDLVHVNLVDPASNAATLAAALAVAPTTATLHLSGATDDGWPPGVVAGLYADLDLLLTPSRDCARQVRTSLSVPRGGVVVTCNGVDIPQAPHGPAGNRPPRIGVHGRLTRQKGVDLLLTAVRRLLAGGLAVQVTIAGAGREEPALRAAAEGLPVRFAGWVTEPRRFLSELDLFCLPSRHEALPLALLEAMAEGLPCVATDVGDIRHRLGHALALVPPGNAEALASTLEGLLRDPALRLRLAARARRCAERHLDADQMASVTYGHLHRAFRRRARVDAGFASSDVRS